MQVGIGRHPSLVTKNTGPLPDPRSPNDRPRTDQDPVDPRAFSAASAHSTALACERCRPGELAACTHHPVDARLLQHPFVYRQANPGRLENTHVKVVRWPRCEPSRARRASRSARRVRPRVCARRNLDVPVATATLDRLLASPLGPNWLPLDGDRRLRLPELLDGRSHERRGRRCDGRSRRVNVRIRPHVRRRHPLSPPIGEHLQRRAARERPSRRGSSGSSVASTDWIARWVRCGNGSPSARGENAHPSGRPEVSLDDQGSKSDSTRGDQGPPRSRHCEVIAAQRCRMATPAELADYLQVPVRSLYQWRYQGRGPLAHRVGCHLRYRWEDVEDWLTTRARERTR
jgi:hypothetical protein